MKERIIVSIDIITSYLLRRQCLRCTCFTLKCHLNETNRLTLNTV